MRERFNILYPQVDERRNLKSGYVETGLELSAENAAAIVRYREQNGGFKTIGDLKKVPGVDAAKIEAKKDRVEF